MQVVCMVCIMFTLHYKRKDFIYLQLKTLTDLLNILIQLLIRIDLPHQVLQLLLTENLERKQMYPFTQLQKSTCVVCSLY